jgi:hypothetical protein
MAALTGSYGLVPAGQLLPALAAAFALSIRLASPFVLVAIV